MSSGFFASVFFSSVAVSFASFSSVADVSGLASFCHMQAFQRFDKLPGSNLAVAVQVKSVE